MKSCDVLARKSVQYASAVLGGTTAVEAVQDFSGSCRTDFTLHKVAVAELEEPFIFGVLGAKFGHCDFRPQYPR